MRGRSRADESPFRLCQACAVALLAYLRRGGAPAAVPPAVGAPPRRGAGDRQAGRQRALVATLLCFLVLLPPYMSRPVWCGPYSWSQ